MDPKLKNLNTKAVEYIIPDVGEEPTSDNLALYRDRKDLYGIEHFDTEDSNNSSANITTLSQKVVQTSKDKNTCKQ